MIEDVLKRANLDYISRFILYGGEPLKLNNSDDYDRIIIDSLNLFKYKLNKKIENEDSQKEIINRVYLLLNVYEDVYFITGLQAGVQLRQNLKL